MKFNRRGLIASIVYHLLILLLMIFAGLTFPVPPPEEEGILVNFGTDAEGLGEFEPQGDDQQAGEPEEPVVEEIIEEEAEPLPQETYTPPEPTPVDHTQDVEETKVKEEPKPTPEELQRQREEQERIRREREEQERLERERLEQERIERERREEQERIERERQEKAERLNRMGQSAFGNQGEGEGEGSEGITQGDGNQGDLNGSPDADRYGTGDGLGNRGIGFGLEGRGSRSLPLPDMAGCEVTQKITVTVDIQVDPEGRVVKANVKNASYQDKCIWDMVVEAAMKSRFTANQAAAYRQTGWIKYIIVP